MSDPEIVDTPAVVIDEDVARANILRIQAFFDDLGVSFRPHIKTHKMVRFATLQRAAGAKGINAQKLSEAAVFADAGFDDILVTFNVLGDAKLAELSALHRRVPKLSVVADNAVVVSGLARVGTTDRPLNVLVECDVGGGRCGVQSPQAAAELARSIASLPTLRYAGLLAYPKANTEQASDRFFSEAVAILAAEGIVTPTTSYGGTPSLLRAADIPSATEYRAGTYIFNDRSLLEAGACTLDQCALTIHARVVSRPTADRAIVDAGSKVLSSDLLGLDGYGLLTGYPGARIGALSEEHGIVDLSACGPDRPNVGDVVEILPNHACVVVNLASHVFIRAGGRLSRQAVDARGLVT